MSEIKPGFARDWVEFADPNDEEEIFKCDLTWLTSFWTCIYGDGCQGVFKDRPNDGCCTEGAMYSDEYDEERVRKAAEFLTPDMWQFYEEARPKKPGGKLRITDLDEDNDRKTRTVNNACIFLNRKGHEAPGFTGDFGCVLHHLAQKRNIHFVDTKPDVCWQLPLRRSFAMVSSHRCIGLTRILSNWLEPNRSMSISACFFPFLLKEIPGNCPLKIPASLAVECACRINTKRATTRRLPWYF